jgi:biopolymer transport protein ExbD
MLTAHVMESGIEVDVPAVRTTKETTKDLPVISISKDGSYYLGDEAININLLVPTLEKRYRGQSVYVRADKAVNWEIVAQVMSELGAAKIGVSAVTKPEEIKRGRR